MAVEHWNKVSIPYPSVTAFCKVIFNEKTAAITERAVLHCESVLKLLNSEVFQTELRVLQKLLYVMHNSFRQHKPYCAIKQVEQCVKRLNEMKLQGVVQDFQEMCPNPIQREVGVSVGQCDVPSQPMLEWFCLKLLGASHLLCRTLDQCTKAFLLSKQHLGTSEFIVLNLLLVSMLSRLWVFFRGVLRALMPVYQSIKDLLDHVVQYRPMPYLTDFTLPGDLAAFLGLTRVDLLSEKAHMETLEIKGATKLLNRLFEDGAEEQRREGVEQMGIVKALDDERVKPNADLGKAILRQGSYCSSSPLVLDIKSILHKSPGISQQSSAEILIEMESPAHQSDPNLAIHDQKRAFLNLLKTASSFSEVAVHLEEMMGWCRRCKLRQECCSLAFIQLRCRKMQAMECKGDRLQRKLQKLHLMVHRVLEGTSRHASSQRRPRTLRTAQFPTLMARYGSVKERFRRTRKQSCLARDLFGAKEKSLHKYRKGMKAICIPSIEKVVSNDINKKDKKTYSEIRMVSVKSSNVNEIDDIFASAGL